MADAKFTPVDHDPFNIQGNAPGFIGALAHYIVPGAIGAQMAGADTANLAKGIAHNVGVYGRALQGENIPLDDLIDASNTVAGLVATGGLGASVPKGALGANILSYSKEKLLQHVEPVLQEKAGNIFDAMQKNGWSNTASAVNLLPKDSTIEDFINHVDASNALQESAKKLASSVTLAGKASPTGSFFSTPEEANAAAIKATGGPPLGSGLTPFIKSIIKYSKQDLLSNIKPDLQDKASSIYDTIVSKGLDLNEAAAHLLPDNASWENYLEHTSAATALTQSANTLAAKKVPGRSIFTPSGAMSVEDALANIEKKLAALPSGVLPSELPPKPVSALKPLNWQDYVPPDVGKAGSDWLRANPEVANLLFAKQAGFNTNVPLYKGMSRPLEGEGFRPASNASEPALFFATEPDVAAVYSAAGGPMDAPNWYRSPSSILAYARAQNPFQVDWRGVGGEGEYSSYKMNALLEDARARNADLLAIHNISDIAEPRPRSQTQIAVMDPSILRSPWAQFDPNRLHEADLLASRGLPLFIPVDHNPFAQQQGRQ